MAAVERLMAAQEIQMELLERGSNKLVDHIAYWGAVRQENVLLHAARKNGVKAIGMCPVPPLSASAARAKEAIQMQLLCQELSQTVWARDSWSLTDVSVETFNAPPKGCFKKGARIVEVTYDGNPENKNWYTCWSLIYKPTEDGWTFATGGTDEKGLFLNMDGNKTHYLLFAADARKYSASGIWQVNDQDNIFVSSTSSAHSRDTGDGAAAGEGSPQHGEAAFGGEEPPFQSQPGPRGSLSSEPGPVRRSISRIRGGGRPSPYTVPQCSRNILCTPPPSPLPSPLPLDLAPAPDIQQAPPSPDSTGRTPSPSSPPALSGPYPTSGSFQLFPDNQKTFCLLLSGNPNSVKCLRFRAKRYHRHRFETITTTLWATGEEGAERKGLATVILTFSTWEQRQHFLNSVSIPTGITQQMMAVTSE